MTSKLKIVKSKHNHLKKLFMKKLKWSVMAFFAIMGVSQAQVKINSTTATTVSSGDISNFNSGIGNTTTLQAISTGTGSHNNAFGFSALNKNAGGSYNTAIGNYSLMSNISGIGNTGIGYNSLYFNTGSYNTAIGFESLKNNKGGSHNIGFGYQSLFSNSAGINNIAIGREAGKTTTGSNNVFLGYQTGFNVSGSNNTIIGSNIAGNSTLNNHVIIGDGSGKQRILINQKGSVGIGNTNPQFGLHVGGVEDHMSTTHSLASIGIGTNTVPGRLILAHAAKDQYYCNQAKKGDVIVSGSTTGSLILASENAGGSTPGNAGQGIKFVTQDTEPMSQVRMTIDKKGKVLVGTETAPNTVGTANVSTYNLFVKGGILTEEMRVRLATDWADYVFNKNYVLKPLKEVEKFINTNGHLPNVPSAKEVKENGLELGNIVTIQQEKIEELTLYAIQQQKEMEELKALVKTLVEKK